MTSSSLCTQNSLIEDISPYFDFISMSQKVSCFDRSGLKVTGDNKYQLIGEHKQIDVSWSDLYQTLTVSGSLPWYKQGHNLFFDETQFTKTVEDISIILDIDLASSVIRSFEVSKILPVKYPVEVYQNNHYELSHFERNLTRNTLYYNSYTRRGVKRLTLKMYDATLNAMNKKMTIVPDGNWIKWEMKVNKPEKHFKQVVTVLDMINDEQIINKSYSEMKQHYQNIEKGYSIDINDSPTTEDLLLCALIKSNPNPMGIIGELIRESNLGSQAKYRRKQLIKDKLKGLTVRQDKYLLDL